MFFQRIRRFSTVLCNGNTLRTVTGLVRALCSAPLVLPMKHHSHLFAFRPWTMTITRAKTDQRSLFRVRLLSLSGISQPIPMASKCESQNLWRQLRGTFERESKILQPIYEERTISTDWSREALLIDGNYHMILPPKITPKSRNGCENVLF